MHRARLHDGTVVAVKVQYPGLATAVAADLFTLRWAARAVAALSPRAPPPPDGAPAPGDESAAAGLPDLSWLVAQLERNLRRELDFVAEGRAAERTAAAFAAAAAAERAPAPVATAPGVVWDRTARRVLTMRWVDGCRVRAGGGHAVRGSRIRHAIALTPVACPPRSTTSRRCVGTASRRTPWRRRSSTPSASWPSPSVRRRV